MRGQRKLFHGCWVSEGKIKTLMEKNHICKKRDRFTLF